MANTILLKDIPKSISKEIDAEQADHKKNTDIKLNQSQVVIKMLRDYIRCRKLNNFNPDAQ